MSRVAMCWVHDEPLVMTMIVPKYEFVCMVDGALYEFLGPRAAEETKKLLAKCDRRKAAWEKLVADIIVVRSWHRDCAQCQARQGFGDYHADHASRKELAADEAARKRIVQRYPKLAAHL